MLNYIAEFVKYTTKRVVTGNNKKTLLISYVIKKYVERV